MNTEIENLRLELKKYAICIERYKETNDIFKKETLDSATKCIDKAIGITDDNFNVVAAKVIIQLLTTLYTLPNAHSIGMTVHIPCNNLKVEDKVIKLFKDMLNIEVNCMIDDYNHIILEVTDSVSLLPYLGYPAVFLKIKEVT
jgi:hypothetical protein